MWLSVLTLWAGCGAGPDDNGPLAEATSRPPLASWVPDGFGPTDLRRVVFLGDSITWGWGASVPDLAYKRLLQGNVDAAWPDATELDLQRFGALEVLDFSLGGATTETLRDGQLRALDDHLDREGREGPTAVFMTIGGNDIQVALFSVLAGGGDAAERVADGVEERMDDILAFLTDPARFPDGVSVLFTNVYDPTDDVGQADTCFGGLDVGYMRAPLADTNARMRDAALRWGAGMVDLYGLFQGHGMYADDPENPAHDPLDPSVWYTSDCIHPNDRGHHELRRHFVAALEGAPLDRSR